MKLPTPDCPWCSRRTEDRGDHFACLRCDGPPLPDPVAWYRDLAAGFGRNAASMMAAWPLANYAYREARWAARAALSPSRSRAARASPGGVVARRYSSGTTARPAIRLGRLTQGTRTSTRTMASLKAERR